MPSRCMCNFQTGHWWRSATKIANALTMFPRRHLLEIGKFLIVAREVFAKLLIITVENFFARDISFIK